MERNTRSPANGDRRLSQLLDMMHDAKPWLIEMLWYLENTGRVQRAEVLGALLDRIRVILAADNDQETG